MEEMKKKRGFGAMTPERQREIASKGGHAAHASGKGHRFTTEKAREAGRLGGLASQQRKREASKEVAATTPEM